MQRYRFYGNNVAKCWRIWTFLTNFPAHAHLMLRTDLHRVLTEFLKKFSVAHLSFVNHNMAPGTGSIKNPKSPKWYHITLCLMRWLRNQSPNFVTGPPPQSSFTLPRHPRKSESPSRCWLHVTCLHGDPSGRQCEASHMPPSHQR